MRSGSKRSAVRPPELSAWQVRVLDAVASSGLRDEVVFGGGAALAAVHLHHRRSDDVDFFLGREVEASELEPVARALARGTVRVDIEVVPPRTSLVLRRPSGPVGKIDFAFYPYDPVGRRTTWRGLVVESLADMTVNKVQAVLTREQVRDFVDLYFLLREGPERDLNRLLDYVRAKFDYGAHRMGLAARFLLVKDLERMPRMIRELSPRTLVAFFEQKARELVAGDRRR
ncbi:MAG: nucleotidyl transferase AbiEii/AbiGii toxin family protein [Deltaproteobacteria bacterium]|nr:nucleotidyl transferase AbiEii/AbiGii toxin family protein [Deltaproteobacteria bacterium]